MMVSIAGMYGFVNIWDLPYWIGALFAVVLVPISTFWRCIFGCLARLIMKLEGRNLVEI